jgi:hypothetical protein
MFLVLCVSVHARIDIHKPAIPNTNIRAPCSLFGIQVLRSRLYTASFGGKHNNKKFWKELIAYFPWYDKGQIEKTRSTILLLLRVYLLPRRDSFSFLSKLLGLSSQRDSFNLLSKLLSSPGGTHLVYCPNYWDSPQRDSFSLLSKLLGSPRRDSFSLLSKLLGLSPEGLIQPPVQVTELSRRDSFSLLSKLQGLSPDGFIQPLVQVT